jgi:hypothetical protein
MRIPSVSWILLLALLAPGLHGDDGIVPIMEQIPDDLKADLVDPLTVEKRPPFEGGESLSYKLGWSMFTVARSTLTCAEGSYNDRPAMEINLKTRTNSFADTLYKVRNHSISWIDADVSWSYEYKAVQDEGGRHRNTIATFDPDALTGNYVNHNSEDTWDTIQILPGTFDPLGIVFFLRCLEFDVGDELVIPTSNGKEFFYTIVRVTKKIRKKFRYGGRQEAWVLEPDIKDVGGVFKRSPDGNIRFYISADERKLPLRMESEVAVGSFWAELVEINDPPEPESIAVAEVE